MTSKAFLIAILVCAQAQAVCLPEKFGAWVVSSNTKGDWVGWWCPGAELPYIAACPKSVCSLVGSKRAVAAWLTNPAAEALKFGADPHTDPALRSVWGPERAKLDAIKPASVAQ